MHLVLIAKVEQDNIETVVDMNDALEAPITKGQEVGKMLAMVDGKSVASVSVVATSDIAEAGFFKRTWQHISRWFGGLF